MTLNLRHDRDQRAFVADLEGGEARLDYARISADTLDYRHTFVPDALRGAGVGERLVRNALDYARDNDLRVIPTCPFVRHVIDQNPEYRNLVTEPPAEE